MARRRQQHEEHENHERWLVSYADFITLLFAFFVVMYSISSINDGKYRVLSDSLIAAFRTPAKSLDPIQFGQQRRPSLVDEQRLGPQPLVLEPGGHGSTLERMANIAAEVEKAMRALIDQNLIRVHRNKLWVEVEINTSILFPSGSADLEPEAVPILRRLAGVLAPLPNHLHVEGFTDDVPIRTPVFPSNWELSAARAASVVHLFMDAGVEPERMAAIGYGEYRPLEDNATPEGRQKNRRVVVVVLADPGAPRIVEIARQPGAAPVEEPVAAPEPAPAQEDPA